MTAFARRYRIDSLDKWQSILRLLTAMRPDCERYPVILAAYEERNEKSHDQRKGFHYLCSELGRHMGLTPAETKQLIKTEFYGLEVKVILGKRYEFVQSSEDSDRAEYSRLIDFLFQFAAEQGFVLPDLRAKDTAHG